MYHSNLKVNYYYLVEMSCTWHIGRVLEGHIVLIKWTQVFTSSYSIYLSLAILVTPRWGLLNTCGTYHPLISPKKCDVIAQNWWYLMNIELWTSPTLKNYQDHLLTKPSWACWFSLKSMISPLAFHGSYFTWLCNDAWAD